MSVKIITNPESFFERRVSSGLALPTTVIGVSILAGVSLNVVYARNLTQGLPNDVVGHVMALTLFMGVFSSVLQPVLLWLLLSGVFHTISVFLGGEGRFKRVLAATGWGFLPQAVYWFALFGATWLATGTISPPQSTAEMDAFTNALESDPVYGTVATLRPAFMVWSGFLWTFGLKQARNLSMRQALMTVGLPVGVLLALQLA